MKLHIPAIDVEITSRCNLACEFCWGAPRQGGDTEMSLQRFEHTLNFMRESFGTSSVVYNGGEPTLVPNLEEYLAVAKRIGFRNCLSTHGMHIARRTDILELLHAVAIPIDGVSAEVCNRMRPPNGELQQRLAVEAIRSINSNFPELNIKIGTVFCSYNAGEIAAIGQLIIDRALKIATWKLYEYFPFGHRKNDPARPVLESKSVQFHGIVREIQDKFPQLPIVWRLNSAKGAHLLIRPNGSITTEQHTETGIIEPHLGNIFEDNAPDLLVAIGRAINPQAMEVRLHTTYNV